MPLIESEIVARFVIETHADNEHYVVLKSEDHEVARSQAFLEKGDARLWIRQLVEIARLRSKQMED